MYSTSVPKSELLSRDKVILLENHLQQIHGKEYKFFRFLNLSKLSLVFTTEDGDQQVLVIDHASKILKYIREGE